MPLFTMVCPECEHEEEILCKADERSTTSQLCPHDGTPMDWKGVELPRPVDLNGNKSGRFQMKAITQAGKVAGHFGKTARNK
jgi:hypothetical protein